MIRILVFAVLVPLSIQQLSCNSCGTSSQSTSRTYSNSYGTNTAQRDDTSSSNTPGYLPDYQGDRYTDPQRIAETQALNKEFFDSIGGAPSPPPLTPAQEGMNGTSSSAQYSQASSSSGWSTSTSYQPSSSNYLSSQNYNPSSTISSNSQFYSSNPSTTSSSSNRQYDSNQNSPYYYQRVPSTQEYNSILGVNAGFPQLAAQQRLYDSNGQDSTTANRQYDVNSNNNYETQNQNSYQKIFSSTYINGNSNNGNSQYSLSIMHSQQYPSTSGYSNQQDGSNTYLSNTQSNQYESSTINPSTQQYNSNSNNYQQYGEYQSSTGSAAYNNQQQYDSPNQLQQYESSNNQQMNSNSGQYSPDAISCCSQVSSTCCYQIAPSSSSSSNVLYNPSVYQYGQRR